MRRLLDSLNKCTKYLPKMLGDIANLAICKYWSKHIFKTNTLMLFIFFKLPTNALGMWNCLNFREFKYIKAVIRMEAMETWYFQR